MEYPMSAFLRCRPQKLHENWILFHDALAFGKLRQYNMAVRIHCIQYTLF